VLTAWTLPLMADCAIFNEFGRNKGKTAVKELLGDSMMGPLLSRMVQDFMAPTDKTYNQAVGNNNFAIVHSKLWPEMLVVM